MYIYISIYIHIELTPIYVYIYTYNVSAYTDTFSPALISANENSLFGTAVTRISRPPCSCRICYSGRKTH